MTDPLDICDAAEPDPMALLDHAIRRANRETPREENPSWPRACPLGGGCVASCYRRWKCQRQMDRTQPPVCT